MALIRGDVLAAGITSFVAWGFVTHWLPLLRYIGYAFITGIAVAYLTLAALTLLISRRKTHYGEGRKRLPKSAAFISPKAWKGEVEYLRMSSVYSRETLFPRLPLISKTIDVVLDLLLRDFVTAWYSNISRKPSFTDEVDRALRTALVSISHQFVNLDLVEIAVSRILPIVTAHLKEFHEAEVAVRGRNLNRDVTESEELDLAIAGKYRQGRLHQAATLSFSDIKLVQQEHLRRIVGNLLPTVLPHSILKSRVVGVLIKEIVACAVLYPVMQIFSDPDTWNQVVEAYGHTMLQDRKSVRKLRAALDEHASPGPKAQHASSFPRLAPTDNERKFERFVRAARQCSNLSDARRFRSEVASQLKREAQIEGHDRTYIRRLETGKRILDHRVAYLSAGDPSVVHNGKIAGNNQKTSSRLENATLAEVLHDASGLSYFMEYMDRQRMMHLVQFWIVVDGFRNPLEDDLMENEAPHSALPRWTESDRADLAQISEAYLARPELGIPGEYCEAVKLFLRNGQKATPMQYHRARRAVLQAQAVAFEEMEDRHFTNFKKSDLYYKYLASDEVLPNSVPSLPSLQPTLVAMGEQARATVKDLQGLPPRPQVVSRTSSRVNTKGLDLRRLATSSADLKASAKPNDAIAPPRRSLDTGPSTPLFDDDYDVDPLSRSMQSLDTNGGSEHPQSDPDNQVVRAMEAALTDIMEDKSDAQGLKPVPLEYTDPIILSPEDKESLRGSLDLPTVNVRALEQKKERPNLASLGLVNTSSRIGVFSDDDLFPVEERFLEDEHEDPHDIPEDNNNEDEIHEAAPGDLGLAEAIAALTADIDRLAVQNSVLDSLTRKAELTNNIAELRILRKSESSLQREIRRKEMQRQQYIVQESDNSLYGRATLMIKSIVVGNEDDGREYALLADVIEVRRKAGEHMPGATWAIARRYSEFHDLHQRLRSKYSSVRYLEFPRRRMVMKLQREFLHKRRLALEHYLRELLLLPDVCRSRDLRAFLSQQAIVPSDGGTGVNGDRKDIVTRIYNSVTDGMDDFLGNIPVLDQLSIAGQNLISAATNQLGTLPPAITEDPVTAAEAEAELNAFENRDLEPFVKPICDIFLEIFELNRGSNWLRGRAVVVVLHQLLGGTIERKVRENAKMLTQEDSVVKYLNLVKDTMWPNGNVRREMKARIVTEKARTRTEASLVLATLIPDLAGSVVGRANAQAASRRLFATLNNQRLK
ncbi:MAG: Intermediate filament protein [Candelina mexicana]|nr:MAG: Intermediate filament protein [Candelina mexicana]